MSLQSFIHDAELKALNISKEVWAFLEPLIANGFQQAVANALPIVEPIVLGLATDPTKRGADKASAALAAAVPALEAAGINAGTNVIKAAIEATVAKLPAPTASTSPASVSSLTPPVAVAATSAVS